MLTNKRYNVLIEFKNGDLKHTHAIGTNLAEQIFEEYDSRKINRLKIPLKDSLGHIIGYHIFYDELVDSKRYSVKPITMQYVDEEVKGYIDYIAVGVPYYTFAKVGERRGLKIDVSLIKKFIS